MPKAPTFVDRVKITVSAGHGGNGCVSFRREKYIPRGGPNGGDGGNGGSVYLVADKDVDSLVSLYYQPLQRAEHGQNGQGKDCYGRGGKDLRIKVPIGTDVYTAEDDTLLGEVIEDGQALLVAKGGRGGKGNIHFKSSTNQAPRQSTPGTQGEARKLRLELKSMADIGLVGYPNAGKSTLLRAVSAARPKTAAYPFTTLHPMIGVVEYEDHRTLRVADIPGLIEGAHAGVGLGHDFLRHIERTRFLLFVVDMAGVDGRNPVDDYSKLRKELALYREDLGRRPSLVVANKMDLPEAGPHHREFEEKTGLPALPISAEKGTGVPALKAALAAALLNAATP